MPGVGTDKLYILIYALRKDEWRLLSNGITGGLVMNNPTRRIFISGIVLIVFIIYKIAFK